MLRYEVDTENLSRGRTAVERSVALVIQAIHVSAGCRLAKKVDIHAQAGAGLFVSAQGCFRKTVSVVFLITLILCRALSESN